MKILDREVASRVAGALLSIEAIRLQPKNPFTWASGWKAPIYCDNRRALSFPKIRSYIKEQLVQAAKTFQGVEAIAGVATAGIPQGALVADALGLPFIYVRAKPKGHGMGNSIEGKISPGQRVLVVEDLVSTGGSSLKAVQDLRAAGFEVMGMLAIFTYGFELARQNFETAEVSLLCLSDYAHLLPKALADDYIDEEALASLVEWRKNPETWGTPEADFPI
ncbi:MAG: orotate phosphoribosyltransferase [Nitritalea sp.]